MYANLKPSRQKMTIGPWTHSAGFGGEIHRAEVRRWFDRWLKGIDNGIMREKSVHYYLMRGNNTVPDNAGQSSSQDEIDALAPKRAQVIGDVEHVVALPVRAMPLQHTQRPVDLTSETHTLNQLTQHTDTSRTQTSPPTRELIHDAAFPDNRARTDHTWSPHQPALDPTAPPVFSRPK